jgi:hypothetical protein
MPAGKNRRTARNRQETRYPQPAFFIFYGIIILRAGKGILNPPYRRRNCITPQPAIFNLLYLNFLNLCYNKIAGWEDLSE